MKKVVVFAALALLVIWLAQQNPALQAVFTLQGRPTGFALNSTGNTIDIVHEPVTIADTQNYALAVAYELTNLTVDGQGAGATPVLSCAGYAQKGTRCNCGFADGRVIIVSVQGSGGGSDALQYPVYVVSTPFTGKSVSGQVKTAWRSTYNAGLFLQVAEAANAACFAVHGEGGYGGVQEQRTFTVSQQGTQPLPTDFISQIIAWIQTLLAQLGAWIRNMGLIT